MSVQAFIEGNLGAFLRAQAVVVEKGSARGLRRVTGGIRGQIRRNITRAGFTGGGRQLASTVRSRVRGEGTDVEGVVYSKATYAAGKQRPGGPVDLVQLFAQGTTIRSARGGWLAIPTQDAPLKAARGRGQRMTPGDLKAAGERVRFIPARGSRLIAVVRRGGRDVVTHVLVRQLTLRRRFDLESAIDRWTARLPEILATEINRAANASAVLSRYGG